ncbi:MAG: hypothetical protein ACYC47_02835 [Desulfobacteria bacterium]
MKNVAKYLLWVAILSTFATPAFAETRTISWDPVTTYTDNTPIEAGKTVTYSAYWTTDPGLSIASLHTIGTSLTTTSTTFDPTVQGMTRGGTVYFTAKAVLNTGEESSLSPAYSWVVPLVTPPPAVLSSIAVSGPSSVNESGTATYTATGTWDNGTTAAITPTWSVSPTTYASISIGGVLTTLAVTANQTVTVTASYTSGGVTKTASQGVTIVNAANVLTSISVSGPSSVNEGGSATYTATGTWDNGATAAITPTWSVSPTTYASISAGGVLTTLAVTANQTVTVAASYTSGGVTKTASQGVTIVNVANVLTGIAVSGPSSVNEGGSATYTATGTWDNGATAAITPTWSVSPTTYASISAGGVLTTLAVTANQTVTVTASYTSGGVTKTSSQGVTIVDVPGPPPAAPKNIGISGPISSRSTEVWRLAWDPVTTYTDDAPLEPGRTVRYTAYWTDDPALSAGSLRQLGSLVSATALDFDPIGRMMAKNQMAYLTVRAVLDNGDESSLAAALSWVVANSGPKAPAGGAIKKK